MTMRFSQSRLIDQRRFGHRTRFLGQRAFRAYFDLTEHYWEFGRLFSEDADLADVCGLHVQAFRRIKEQLSRLFDVDDVGLWRDPELEAERARAMQRSATNRANGRKGGQARWEPEDPEGMGWGQDAGADAVDGMAKPMANGMAFAMDAATGNEAENDRSAVADAMPLAMPHATSGGSIDRSSIEDSETIDRSNPCAGEDVAMANGMAIATPVAIPVDVSPNDAELHARVLSACGDNITAELRQSRDVEPIRALMRDGFDLDREILPLLRDRVKAFKAPVRTLRAPWIREALSKAKAVGTVANPSTVTTPARTFVAEGTPEWTACQAREVESGHKPKKPVPNGNTGQKGNWFPTPLPSAARPSIAAE